MMMNGELMEKATGGKPGSFLARPLDRRSASAVPARSHGQLPLSRRPEPVSDRTSELAGRGSISTRIPDTICVLQDLFWALLNSNEFVLNH